MSSSHQPIYWDSLGQSLAPTTAYGVDLPVGTTDWTVVNMSAGTIIVAATAATIATGVTNSIPVLTGTSLSGKGQQLFVGNLTGGALAATVVWHRPGRQPDMDAGTASWNALP